MNKSNFKIDSVQHKHILRANDNIRKYKVGSKKVRRYQPRILRFDQEVPEKSTAMKSNSKEPHKSQIQLEPLGPKNECPRRVKPRSSKKIKRIIINQDYSTKKIGEDQDYSYARSEGSPSSVSSRCSSKRTRNIISVENSVSGSKFQVSKFAPEKFRSPSELWKVLITKAVPSEKVDPVKLSLFKLKRTRNLVKRAVNTLSTLFLKRKEAQRVKTFERTMIGNWVKEAEMQSGLQDNLSDSSSDLSRGEEEQELEKINLNLNSKSKCKSKPTKFLPTNLEPIPEASIRLEETLLKNSSNLFMKKPIVFSSGSLAKLKKPGVRTGASDELIRGALRLS